ncbi:MAG TPA: C1 family peptidase [Polyangiaceae bacterium]|nr:C1 family peptidase [Polyangiaceae bacterium]
MISACRVTGGSRQAAPPAPAPYGYPPEYASRTYPAAPPQLLAQFAQAEAAQRNAVRATPPPPAVNVLAQLNVAALGVVARMFPKGCAAFQVTPGNYVHLDCRRYGRVASARVVNPANKLAIFGAGQLRLDPPSLGAFTPPLLLTGLESLLFGQPPPAPGPAPRPGPAPTPSPPQTLPAAVDHRQQGTEGPIKDQQLVGACTAFSLSSVMDNAIRRLNASDVVSAMHIWSRYADPTMPSAEARNEGRPLSIWVDYPYDERTACRMESQDDGCAELLLPPVQVNSAASDPGIQAQIRNADSRGRYTIAEIDQIDPIDPNVLAVDIATGKDIWFAMGVSQDAWTSPLVQATATVPDWITEDGGHAVALAGYRTTPVGRQFLVHNSWGTSWGDGGYAWVSEAMLRSHGQYAYTVKVVDRAAPPPPPTPVPAPRQPNGPAACPAGFAQAPGLPICQKMCSTAADCGGGGACVRSDPTTGPALCVATNPLTDDDCGEGELVDLVTGQCAPACTNGWRPAAGWCAFGTAAAR